MNKQIVSLHVGNMFAFFAAFAVMVNVFVSCADTSTIGGIEEEYFPVPPQGDSATVVEEYNFDTEFDTRTAELYTVYQTVEGDRVLKDGKKEISREHFEKSLDLNALFAHPEVVYVSNENQLGMLEEKGVVEGKVTVEPKEEANFVRNILKQDFDFTLNTGEEIKASTKYEKCICTAANQELSFTAIRNIQWDPKSSKATLNEMLSCEDSTVYDVVLAYNVALTRNDNTEMTKTQTVSNYTVNVPYHRVYKAGDHKIADMVDEEKTKRELVLVSGNTYVERFTVVTYEQWSESGRVRENVETINVPVVFNAPEAKWIVTTNASYVTTANGVTEGNETSKIDGNFTVKTKPVTYTSDADNNANAFTNTYSGVNNAVTYQKGSIVVDFGYGEWTVKEGETTIDGPKDVTYKGVIYNGYDYVNNIDWTYSIKADKYAAENNEISKPAQANATILIAKVADEKLADKVRDVKREIITDETGIKERITITTYEQWRDAGEQNEVTEMREFPILFNAPGKKRVITTSSVYTTKPQSQSDGNETSATKGSWTVKTKSFNYVSKADNGVTPFTNTYEGSSSAIVYTKGEIKLEFDYGEWTVREVKTTIDGPRDVTYEGIVYDGYDYVNNINWTYSIAADKYATENNKVSNSEKAEVTILIAKAEKADDVKIADRLGSVKREIVSDNSGIKERITITTYEEWRDAGKQKEVTDMREFPIVFNAPGKKQVITTSAAYQTVRQGMIDGAETSARESNWTVRTKPFTYSSKADNGADMFMNTYQGSSSAIVYTKGDIKVEFDYGTWQISEGRTTIDPSGEVNYNGHNYDRYDYVNNINWTYSIAADPYAVNAEVNKTAKAEVTILIAKEEVEKKLTDKVGSVTREIVPDNSGVKERITITTYQEDENGQRGKEETETREFPIVFKAPGKETVITTSADYTTTTQGTSGEKETSRTDGHWTIKTKSFNYSSKADNHGIRPFTNTYEASSSSVVFEKGSARVELAYGSWNIEEGTTTIGAPKNVFYSGRNYDGYDYVNNVNWTYTIPKDAYVQGSTTSQKAKAEVQILIEKVEEDKLLSKKGLNVKHEILDENRDKFTWDEVETWSVGGTKTTQKEWIRYRHFNEPNKQTVYTTNKNYQTSQGTSRQLRETSSDVNGVKVTTRYMSYTAQSNNGNKSFDNVYTYDFQKGVYTDKDNMYTLTFEFPEWTFEENGTEVSSSSTRNGDYAVWAHTHRINHTYKVTYESSTKTASGKGTALTDIYILDIAKNLPADWGDVLGIQVTAVPADDVDGKYEKHAFCLRTTKGAVAIVINRERALPTIGEITSAHFVYGSFDASYNSAFFTTDRNHHDLPVGVWAPAVGKDVNGGVSYYYKNANVANVSNADLHIWGSWRSVYVSGYNSKLENGVLTLTAPNGDSLRLH